MKPALAHRDIKPQNVSVIDGVTVEVRRSDDPERARRAARLLADLLATPAPDDTEQR